MVWHDRLNHSQKTHPPSAYSLVLRPMSNRPPLRRLTRLDGKYRIERQVGAGGFGITYQAVDELLGIAVAIKEYFPAGLADRDAHGNIAPSAQSEGALFERLKAGFIKEARLLGQFDHPAIVRVSNVFEANGSAYMVMRFEDGPSLKSWLSALDRQPIQDELDVLCRPLLDALQLIHGAGYLHRDIAPDNIIVRPDGGPVLLDFGAARPQMTEFSSVVTGIVKRGFSPPEQYVTSNRSQGPWTDIYALAGTLYLCVSGQAPPESTSRMLADDMPRIAGMRGISGYRPEFLESIDWALSVQPADRPQTISAWRRRLLPDDPASIGSTRAFSMPSAPARPNSSPAGSLVNSAPALTASSPVNAAQPAGWLSTYGKTVAIAGGLLTAATYLLVAFQREPQPAAVAVTSERTPSRSAPPIAPASPQPDPSPKIEAISQPPPTSENGLVVDRSTNSFRDCATCPQMVMLPAGSFLMGSPDTEPARAANEGPQRRITFAEPLAVARLETTRGQWREFATATNRQDPRDCRALQFKTGQDEDYETGKSKGEWAANGEYFWDNTNYPQDDTHPVACVSQADANSFVAWLTEKTGAAYRLPTEAEWEYAAKGGTPTAFPTGSQITPSDARYHYPSIYAGSPAARWVRGTAPAGSFKANGYGLHDMQGNVWEWVFDCAGGALADLTPDGRPPAGDCPTAGMKGGAFWTAPEWTRPAFRYAYDKRLRGAAAGFRVVRSLGPSDRERLAPLLREIPRPAP